MRPAGSVAVTVKPNSPSAVGVPLTTPVAGLTLRPGGRVPVAANVRGLCPPAAFTGWL